MDSQNNLSKKIGNFFRGRKSSESKKIDEKVQKQFQLDKKLVFSLSKSRVPSFRQLGYLGKYLSRTEANILRFCLLVIIVSASYLTYDFYKKHLTVSPVREGEYIEGFVGSPKYINPLYASVNDVDSDIANLVFSSLFKRDKAGVLAKDLVENFEIASSGKEYIFTLRQGAKWHNGADLTVDDVIFTFTAIQDGHLKSPLRSSFEGVALERLDDETSRRFKITLPNPYAAFLDLLTFGIMPAEKWSQISPDSFLLAELNTKPIGSGPYRFDKLVKDTSGSIREYYLSINNDYYGDKPYVNLVFKFYPDHIAAVDALNNSQVNGISYLPREYRESIRTPKLYNFQKLTLPNLTALFFNEKNNNILADKGVRQALAYAISKKTIIENDLSGEAEIVDSPILSSSFAYDKDIKRYDYDLNKAGELLDAAGLKIVELTSEEIAKKSKEAEAGNEDKKAAAESLSHVGAGKWRMKDGEYVIINLTTIDREENRKVAESVKKMWEAAGLRTDISLVAANEIQNSVIKPRRFEVLFYGQVLGYDPDPYAFWHSTQAGEKGLNISSYNNKEADKLLEEARESMKQEERVEKYKKFQGMIAEDVPAIFLYAPLYIYPQSKDLKGFDVKNINMPSDRFSNVGAWYIKTGRTIDW